MGEKFSVVVKHTKSIIPSKIVCWRAKMGIEFFCGFCKSVIFFPRTGLIPEFLKIRYSTILPLRYKLLYISFDRYLSRTTAQTISIWLNARNPLKVNYSCLSIKYFKFYAKNFWFTRREIGRKCWKMQKNKLNQKRNNIFFIRVARQDLLKFLLDTFKRHDKTDMMKKEVGNN